MAPHGLSTLWIRALTRHITGRRDSALFASYASGAGTLVRTVKPKNMNTVILILILASFVGGGVAALNYRRIRPSQGLRRRDGLLACFISVVTAAFVAMVASAADHSYYEVFQEVLTKQHSVLIENVSLVDTNNSGPGITNAPMSFSGAEHLCWMAVRNEVEMRAATKGEAEAARNDGYPAPGLDSGASASRHQ